MSVAAADCSVPITQRHLDLARLEFGETPVVWGRYFNGHRTHPAEYVTTEAARFRTAGLKLLPIAQQTTEVQKAEAAAAHAKMNVEKFISRIGVDRLAANAREYLMFLDVEDDPKTSSPALGAAYFVNWSKALVAESRGQSNNRFTIFPAIYAPRRSNDTWNALLEAQQAGAEPCRAIWVTRSHDNACDKPVPDWNAQHDFRTPAVALPYPIVCWQFALDCPDRNGVDFDLLTADDADRAMLLSRLVVP